MCTTCRASGSWDSLEKSLKRNKLVLPSEDQSVAPNNWNSINEKSIPLKSLPQHKIQEVMDRFKFKVSYYS